MADADASRQPRAVLVAVLLVAVVAALRWDLVRLPSGPPMRPVGQQPCTDLRDGKEHAAGEAERCDDRARNDPRRSPVSETRRAGEAATAVAVSRTVAPDHECLWVPWRCPSALPLRSPGPGDVTAAHEALNRLGHPAVTVRLARVTDPALPGALLYAVRIAPDLCAVGSARTVPYDRMGVDLVGPYPDGTCLDP